MTDRDAATQLAGVIHAAGGTVPVTAIHSVFVDTAPDDGGWPVSKTAMGAIDTMIKTKIATIGGAGDYYTISVNPDVIDLLKAVAPVVKTAQAVATEDLQRISTNLHDLLTKYAAAAAAMMTPEGQAAPAPYDAKAELEVWQKWKKTGEPGHLSELVRRYTPMIRRGAQSYYGSGIPQSVLDAEAASVAMEAFKNYDPAKGAKLSTYVMSYMPKVRGYVIEHQNIARIPEARALRIGHFKSTESDLTSKLGRKPSSHELADSLKWHPDDVAKMRRALRKERVAESTGSAMPEDRMERVGALIDYMHHELTGNEKVVFEHLYGLDGAPKLDTAEDIAKHTGMSVASVEKVRGRIADRAMGAMQVVQ